MTRKTLGSTLANFNADAFFSDKKLKELASLYRKGGEQANLVKAVVNKLNEIVNMIETLRTNVSVAIDENKVATCKTNATKLTHLLKALNEVEVFKNVFTKFEKTNEEFDATFITDLLGDLVETSGTTCVSKCSNTAK